MSRLSASPRAVATEIRMPVKLPGPMPTPIRARSRHVTPSSAKTSSSSGMRRSACPRPISSAHAVRTWSPHSKAAAQCAADVSNPRVSGLDTDRAHLGHFGDVMAQQVLDPHLERDGRGRTAGAGPLHMQVDHPALEAVKGDVATILCHRGAHAGVEQFLDLTDDLGILAAMFGMARRAAALAGHHRLTGLVMLHDRPENRGFDMVPLGAVAFGHGHEIIAEK